MEQEYESEHGPLRRRLERTRRKIMFRLTGRRYTSRASGLRRKRGPTERLRRAIHRCSARLYRSSAFFAAYPFGGTVKTSELNSNLFTCDSPLIRHSRHRLLPVYYGAVYDVETAATPPPLLPNTEGTFQPLSQDSRDELLFLEPAEDASQPNNFTGRERTSGHELWLTPVTSIPQPRSASAVDHGFHAQGSKLGVHPACLVSGSGSSRRPRSLRAVRPVATVLSLSESAEPPSGRAIYLNKPLPPLPAGAQASDRAIARYASAVVPNAAQGNVQPDQSAEARFTNLSATLPSAQPDTERGLPPLPAIPQGRYSLPVASHFLDLRLPRDRCLLDILRSTSSRDNGIRLAGPSRHQADFLDYVPQQLCRRWGPKGKALKEVHDIFARVKARTRGRKGRYFPHVLPPRPRVPDTVETDPGVSGNPGGDLRDSMGSLLDEVRIGGRHENDANSIRRSRRQGMLVGSEGQAWLQDAFRQLDEERAGNAEEHEQEEGCCVGRNEMNDGFYEDDEESLVVW